MGFQHFNLSPHLTVLENVVECPVNVLRMNRDDAVARARHYLAKVGLAEKVERHAGVPDGRAAVQPRCAAAPRNAPRDPRTAAGPGHHDGVCHARPDRSHEHGRPGGAVARRPDRTARHA
ncbi:hypothetical protein G6F61_014641 [Rhizopus arrhizus]|nr:hypothetical protein G6F61_014641 [Rhizopus arrhizus]